MYYCQPSRNGLQTDFREIHHKQDKYNVRERKKQGRGDLFLLGVGLLKSTTELEMISFSKKSMRMKEGSKKAKHQFLWTKSCLQPSFAFAFQRFRPRRRPLLKLSCDEQDPLFSQHTESWRISRRCLNWSHYLLPAPVSGLFHSQVYQVIFLECLRLDIKHYCLPDFFFFPFEMSSRE